MMTGIDHVRITVPADGVAQARAFYCGLLGLPEVEKPHRLEGRGAFWLQVGNRQVHVGIEEGVDRRTMKAHIAYAVVGIGGWRGRLAAAGFEVIEGIPIPGRDRCEFRDPFGNRVEFIEASQDHPWPARSRAVRWHSTAAALARGEGRGAARTATCPPPGV